MNDLLYVSFDFDEEKKEKALCIGRPNPDGSHTVLNMLEGDVAMAVYGCLTDRDREKGEWIEDHEVNSVTCKDCGCFLYPNDIEGRIAYCPTCGRDMR